MRVGINGMGRIGRLALRSAFGAMHRPAEDPRAGNRLDQRWLKYRFSCHHSCRFSRFAQRAADGAGL